eukprot:TRINITY_DN42354_c0_g1_i1.p1 TRINITY_DN42354_c0_g1~~TRINITY_DN42354_c0_g1_i1.p1  ORF type:complete len:767 (-),score=35.04 TRINITY_DN42354_c0_g1_i1:74-2374(-)
MTEPQSQTTETSESPRKELDDSSRGRIKARSRCEAAKTAIGEEKWSEARTEYEAALKVYVSDGWTDLSCGVQLGLMQCCEAQGDVELWFNYALQYFSNPSSDVEDKLKRHRGMLSYVSNKKSEGEQIYPSGLPALDKPLTLKLELDNTFAAVKSQFSKIKSVVFSEEWFSVLITTQFDHPIQFDKLEIEFNQEKYNITQQQKEDKPLLLRPENPNTFSFPITVEDNSLLYCKKITLQIGGGGDSTGACLRLEWSYDHDDDEALLERAEKYNYQQEVGKLPFIDRPLILFTKPTPSLTVELDHTPPALLQEFYSLAIMLSANDDDVKKGEISVAYMDDMFVWLPEDKPDKKDKNWASQRQHGKAAVFPFSSIESQSHKEVTLLLHATRAGKHTIPLTITYESSLAKGLEVQKALELLVVYPFDVELTFADSLLWSTGPPPASQLPAAGNSQLREASSQIATSHPFLYRLSSRTAAFMESTNTFPQVYDNANGRLYSSIQFTPIPDSRARSTDKEKEKEGWSSSGGGGGPQAGESVVQTTFRMDQPIHLTAKLIATTPFPITVRSIELSPAPGITLWQKPVNNPSQIYETLYTGEEYDQAFVIKASESSESVATGFLGVSASRHLSSSGGDDVVLFDLPLPNISVQQVPITIEIQAPITAWLGCPITLTVTLYNTTKSMQAVDIAFHDCRSFFWSGRASMTYDILPQQHVVLSYNLVPIQIGANNLPSFDIKTKDGVHIVTPQDHWVVYIHPFNKHKTINEMQPKQEA